MSGSRPLPADLHLPHPARLPYEGRTRDEILRLHEAALQRGEPAYVDPLSGRLVMTAQTLWDRGACCESGCRHCPYLTRPDTWHGRHGSGSV
jgi:hypothetical protein